MSEQHNICMTIAYDGTNYLGWQKTHTGPSIEQELQAALETILQEKIQLQAASRTDAGVHANGQVVNFFTTKNELVFDSLRYRLNSILPKEIAVKELCMAAPHFHPTLDCLSKEYHYFVCHGKVQKPHQRKFAWHYPGELNWDQMDQAAQYFVGTSNFSAFCNTKKNESYKDHIRTVESVNLRVVSDDTVCFVVKGIHFLYKMVRNIIGTLMYVGSAKLSADQIPVILEGKDRRQAGVTAPAHGLFLHKVYLESGRMQGAIESCD